VRPQRKPARPRPQSPVALLESQVPWVELVPACEQKAALHLRPDQGIHPIGIVQSNMGGLMLALNISVGYSGIACLKRAADK